LSKWASGPNPSWRWCRGKSIHDAHRRSPLRTRYSGSCQRAVYVQWAEHARWLCVREAGVPLDRLGGGEVGPVNLETSIRYHRELRDGDEVDVSCAFIWGNGKTFEVRQDFHRPDGTLIAESRVCVAFSSCGSGGWCRMLPNISARLRRYRSQFSPRRPLILSRNPTNPTRRLDGSDPSLLECCIRIALTTRQGRGDQ